MKTIANAAVTLASAVLMAGCASLAPPLPVPEPAIPAQWPMPERTPVTGADGAALAPAADIGWRDFFTDPALEELIARALANNRDLRTAVLDIERARALYRIQRADRFPTLGLGASATRSGGDGARFSPEVYSVALGITEFELDFFGRVRDLSQAALQRYFAQEEVRRSLQLSLVAEVANVYLTLAADKAQLEVARSTLENHYDAYRLTERRHELGAVSGLDLAQARTTVESARGDVARFAGQVERSINALNLLVGAPVDPTKLPQDFGPAVASIAEMPAGLPSEVLLRRPDILQAEHLLRAANANIGAARAAFFPSIRLTASTGTASDALSALFSGGTWYWALMPQLNLPIFDAGRLQGNLDVAKADQGIALAQYEKAVQSGFREVADALAFAQALADQRTAQEALVEAAERANRLSLARYEAGLDSFFVLLDSQRTLYGAQQLLINIRLAEQVNRVTLYRVLGGGWHEHSP